jgi:hypothetical protein
VTVQQSVIFCSGLKRIHSRVFQVRDLILLYFWCNLQELHTVFVNTIAISRKNLNNLVVFVNAIHFPGNVLLNPILNLYFYYFFTLNFFYLAIFQERL